MRNAIESNGVSIVRTRGGIGIGSQPRISGDSREPLSVEIRYAGKLLKQLCLDPFGPPWRDYLGNEIDHLKLNVRVKQGARLLAELESPLDPLYSFMACEGEQRHISENGVSVPPALHITDELGAVWTLGMVTAEKELSPEGEFAFSVLRDGVDTHAIASRIERRNGVVRVFTRHGWKRWLGRCFS